MDLNTNSNLPQSLNDCCFTGAAHGASARLSELTSPGSTITVIDLRSLTLNESLQPTGRLTDMLSPREKDIFSTFSFRKRILEWLGGRLAAKDAIQRLPVWAEEPDAAQLSIIGDKYGRPVLHTNLQHRVKGLSISHSHDYAVAMASVTGNCGIDIQKKVPKIDKLVDKFTTPSEKSLFSDSNSLQTLTTIWTAKEAVKKSLLHDQPALFQGITINKVEQVSEQHTDLFCSSTKPSPRYGIRVTVTQLDGYILSFTQEDTHA